jgi:hypothetical protein
VQGGAGVSAAGSSVAYVAVRAERNTLLERIRRGTGFVERSRLIRGAWGIPGAAYDGSNTGLSFSERTLVLASFSGLPSRTRLLLMDARPLRPRARIDLPGYFTVDAISPGGRWLYLLCRPRRHADVRVEASTVCCEPRGEVGITTLDGSRTSDCGGRPG